MKIKTTFVTNSSTSSFVAIGTEIELYDIFSKNEEKITEILVDLGYHKDEVDVDVFIDNVYETVSIMMKNVAVNNLSWNEDRDNESLMIGRCYENISDDETIGNVKKEVKDIIKEIFKIDEDPTHIEKVWRDS